MIGGQGRRPSQMQHAFSQVPKAEIPRSQFDRSHGYKTTFDAGYLIPFLVDEALPGDTYKVNATAFARLATPIFPIMDNLYLDTHFFAVPLRLVWNNWEKLNGAQENPGDSTDYLVPGIVSPVGGYAVGSLYDYMGLPTVGQVLPDKVTWNSALFFRAYNLIWNEWFRDQNLQDSIPVPKGDGPDLHTNYVVQRRGKRHDYFTSALPWPQKGPGVSIPLGGSAPIISNNQQMVWSGALGSGGVEWDQNVGVTVAGTPAADGGPLYWGNQSGLVADLTEATAATINSLRQAFQMQKMYERDARGGTRYTEILKAHFGVTSPDARLQRPEYLGGGSTPVGIAPVPQTSGTAAGAGYTPTPQGNLAAVGTAQFSGHGFTHSFTEHCIIIGLVSCRADLTYQQGINRMWHRRSRFDFYWPALAHIGEQSVANSEIYADGSDNDSLVFGYQERFAEYRYKPSLITGLFRSTAANSLDAWHLAQQFGAHPALNSDFIQDNPPVDRIIAVQDEPHFLFDAFIKMHCARPMPTFGVPGYIDHF